MHIDGLNAGPPEKRLNQRSDAAAAPERRGTPRLRTVYRVARILAAGDQGLARVHNISDGGLMLSTALILGPGDPVQVDLSESCTLTGKVAWSSEGRCGIEFDAPIDSAAILKQLYEERHAVDWRPLRLTHSMALHVSSALGSQVVMLRDISQAGMKVAHDGRFTPGLPVKLLLGPDIERRGVVRWTKTGLAGIFLTDILSVEELGSLLAI
jgi:hypothetical protein